MTNIPVPAPSTEIVSLIDGTPKTTSLIVAERFGKIHRDVVRAIKSLECSTGFHVRNFAQSSFEAEMPNGGTRRHDMYEMTRDGFTFLAMGFTGKESARWKEAYIDAFNAMESELRKRTPYGLKEIPKTKKALPGGLTLEQQDAIKALVRSRLDELPKERQGGAAITVWSSIKSKFQVSTYKAVAPQHFAEVLSLISRLPLDGGKAITADAPVVPLARAEAGSRFLVTFGSNGRYDVVPVDPRQALVDMMSLVAIDAAWSIFSTKNDVGWWRERIKEPAPL